MSSANPPRPDEMQALAHSGNHKSYWGKLRSDFERFSSARFALLLPSKIAIGQSFIPPVSV